MNNRKIKFRVWDKAKNQWVHGPGDEANLFGEYIMLGGFCDKISIEGLNELEACQFIGKKDNQGREIYEGDIIKFNILGIHGGREPDMDCVGEVWYCEEGCNWSIGNYHYGSTIDKKQDYDWWYSFMDDIDEKSLTIIGNIFENKELIKK